MANGDPKSKSDRARPGGMTGGDRPSTRPWKTAPAAGAPNVAAAMKEVGKPGTKPLMPRSKSADLGNIPNGARVPTRYKSS